MPVVLPTKKLVYSAMGISIATVASYIHLWNMPMGGSVTLFSMLFITVIGYWLGIKYGLVSAVAYGILQLILEPYMVSLPQIILDYPLAFGALGLSGLFSNKKYGLYIGYVVGVLGRFIFSTLSGVVFFSDYAPENMNVWVYSVLYQGSYLGTEAVMTLVFMSVPAFKKAIYRIKASI